ncbi:hypothetical protein ACTFIZ_007400 [Dictyostelium cf. discoideum]
MVELDTTILNEDKNTSSLTEEPSNAWGRLLSLNTVFPHVEIVDDECAFGRNSTCQVIFTDKKISSKHCRVYRKKNEGQVDYSFYLDDYSSNGTFVNRKRVGKGNTVPIVNGNEISLSTTIEQSDPTRVVYIFYDLEKLRREEEEEKKKKENEESGFTLAADDITNEISVLSDMSPIKKQNSSLSTNSDNSDSTTTTTTTTSTSKLNRSSSNSSVKDDKNSNNNSNNGKLKRKSSELDNIDDDLVKKKTNINNVSIDENKDTSMDVDKSTTITTKTTTNDSDNNNKSDVSMSDENDSKKSTTNTTTTTTTTSTDNNNNNTNTPTKSNDSNNSNNNNNNTPTKTTTTTTTATKKEIDIEETIGENLICGICQDIIYKCLTLIPCMHNFCVCCYGDWRANSMDCPQCRQSVKSAQKNHAINNLIELYLKKNPEKVRDPEELESMDKRCKITDEMLKNGSLNKSSRKYDNEEYEDEDYSEDEEYYSSEEDDKFIPSKCTFCYPNPPNQITGYQCPESPANATYATQTKHLNCSNCYKIFPKEPVEPVGIRCGFCHNAFCNLYQACPKGGNFGKMKDLPVNNLPNDAFGGNQFEVKILNDYLTKNVKTVRQLYLDILEDIDSKKLVIPTSSNIIMPTIPCSEQYRCLGCASHFFSKTLFYYRLSIPKEKLPDYANRDNCYYGKSCRTQFSKFDHAKKLNHICEQTKF